MLKIGVDIRCIMSPIRTGVGEYTYELLNAIFAIDKTNQYYLFYNSYKDVAEHTPLWPQNNIHYVATKWPNKLFNASIKFLGWPKIDKLISRSGKLDYFFSPDLNFISLSKGVKNILTIHDLSFKFFPHFFSAKQRLRHWAINPKKQCQKAFAILTPSENTKRDIVNYYKILPEKIMVAYPGISEIFNGHSEQSEESLKLTKRDPSYTFRMTETAAKIKQKYSLPNRFILFLGAVESRKNIIGLIEAFEKAYSLLPNAYTLVIAGSGAGWKNKQIYDRALASPLRDKIEFIGYVDAKDKPGLYSLAELFVYPSFYEGFGFPVLEAMACGTPVITSNRSSLPEIAENAAFLVNPDRPAELANAIIKMLTDNNLMERLKKSGLEQIKKFNWQKSALKFIGLLK